MSVTTRKWKGYWINGGKLPMPKDMWDCKGHAKDFSAAPYIRGTFTLAAKPKQAVAYVCAPAWHEVYVNGQKVDDRVLAPCVAQYDRHVPYVEYDIAKLLVKGKNAIVFHLGNGLYNPTTPEVWNFVNAYWRSMTCVMADIVCDGKTVACTDGTWKAQYGPVRKNAMRNGEYYDFNAEIPGFADPKFDDGAWVPASRCLPPPGEVIREEMEPCRIQQRFDPISVKKTADGNTLYEFPENIAGWGEITFESKKPVSKNAKPVVVKYGELAEEGTNRIDQKHDGQFSLDGEFQTEQITLPKTGGAFKVSFHSHFTYHGFKYAEVANLPAGVKIVKFEALVIHNDFKQVGAVKLYDKTLDALQKMTMRSYLSNFVGIPTDCPHREKNGWTGDAAIAMRTGLWNYDGIRAYKNYIRIFADSQRPSGQFPGMVPCAGWGYNWGSGPAWDIVIFEAAWNMWMYYKDDEIIREHYGVMRRYLDYLEELVDDDGMIFFGLGDWCEYPGMPSNKVVVTPYAMLACQRMARFAEMMGNAADVKYANAFAARLKKAFVKNLRKGGGHYGNDEMLTLATALYFDICTEKEKPQTAKILAEKLREHKYHCDLGIFGVKFVSRVLAENGYVDDVYTMFTQPEKNGYGYWVEVGSTTLWEDWEGIASRNHIMYGDISAWFYEYVGGIRPDFDGPAFQHFTIEPKFPSAMKHARVEYMSVKGKIAVEWQRETDKVIAASFEIPEGATADIVLPGKTIGGIRGRVLYIVAF